MSLFHERFRQLKKESGKTQIQIANDLGVKQQAISYYSNGREPDYDTLIAIAEYFGVTLDYLLGVSDYRRSENTDFCEKTGLSEQAVEVLTGEEKYVGLALGSANGGWLNDIITSAHYVGLRQAFMWLSDAAYVQDIASRLPTEGEAVIFGSSTRSNYKLVVAALKTQLSEAIIQLADECRTETERVVFGEEV